eukprot:6919365-Ditylum_brightwellii.AAC.1
MGEGPVCCNEGITFGEGVSSLTSWDCSKKEEELGMSMYSAMLWCIWPSSIQREYRKGDGRESSCWGFSNTLMIVPLDAA